MARILQILTVILLTSCSPHTTVMVIECMDGTKYVKCVPMNSKDLYFIKLKDGKENELRKVKIKHLKQKL